MPKLEGSYGVRDGFSDETQEQALEKVSDKRSRIGSQKERFRPVFEIERSQSCYMNGEKVNCSEMENFSNDFMNGGGETR